MNQKNSSFVQVLDHHEYTQEEARIRWGNTQAYQQSQQRTKNWTKEDYDRVTQEGKDLGKKMAETMKQGFDSPEFQELVKRHHASIEIFYDCPLDSYRLLAASYVAEPRFKAHYDDFKPGLAEFLHKAINYYCDDLESKK
jgi:oligoribonuclease NrnB/cAMP/cGMP phosphodiesterase (DHH superfamily)